MTNRRYHDPLVLNPHTLFTSVGSCGSNQPEEVKKLQQMIINAGYQQATGRELEINGKCDQQTIEAIRWYQRLLNLSPDGLVSPVDNGFITALKQMSPHQRQRHHGGPLHVRAGQITFDAEGHDYITAVAPFRAHKTPYFSRVLHWPGGSTSGVTLGRGYDMGGRSRGEVYATLRQAGIEEYKAVICSKAAGLKGNQARTFMQVYGPMVGEISHRQQVKLFEIVYQTKLNEARISYHRHTKNSTDAISWDNLDAKIRDIVVDIFYQSAHDVSTLFSVVRKNDRQELASFIQKDSLYMDYEKDRKRIGYLK